MKVLCLPFRDRAQPFLSFLAEELGSTDLRVFDPEKDIAQQFEGIRVVVDQGGHASLEMIDAGARAGVELWQVSGNGLDHTHVDSILSKKIVLANTPGPFTAVPLAEHAFHLMLCFAKNIRASERNIGARNMAGPLSHELNGRTLGLVGFGASARELAIRARAFGMDVAAIDVVEPPEKESAYLRWCGLPSELPRLLAESDYLSIHVPLTRETRHLIDAKAIRSMKTTAVVINVARGAIVDETALAVAIAEGRIRGAGVDVYEVEPPRADHPLLSLEDVIGTPHIAGSTVETQRRRAAACAENVARVAGGLPILYEVSEAS